jgi:hypothetical protein
VSVVLYMWDLSGTSWSFPRGLTFFLDLPEFQWVWEAAREILFWNWARGGRDWAVRWAERGGRLRGDRPPIGRHRRAGYLPCYWSAQPNTREKKKIGYDDHAANARYANQQRVCWPRYSGGWFFEGHQFGPDAWNSRSTSELLRKEKDLCQKLQFNLLDLLCELTRVDWLYVRGGKPISWKDCHGDRGSQSSGWPVSCSQAWPADLPSPPRCLPTSAAHSLQPGWLIHTVLTTVIKFTYQISPGRKKKWSVCRALNNLEIWQLERS